MVEIIGSDQYEPSKCMAQKEPAILCRNALQALKHSVLICEQNKCPISFLFFLAL